MNIRKILAGCALCAVLGSVASEAKAQYPPVALRPMPVLQMTQLAPSLPRIEAPRAVTLTAAPVVKAAPAPVRAAIIPAQAARPSYRRN